MLRLVVTAAVLVFAITAGATTTHAATIYQATDITQQAGVDAVGMSSSGQVVEAVWMGNCCDAAYLYQNGVSTELNAPCLAAGGYCSDSAAVGINANGQIAGSTVSSAEEVVAYRFAISTNKAVILPHTYPGGGNTWAGAINGAGQIVGRDQSGGVSHAFLWDGTSMHDLGTLGGATSEARATYATGQAVGCSDTATGHSHPFLYANGSMKDLGLPTALPTVTDGCAVSINKSGTILGTSNNPDTGACQTWTWASGKFTILPTIAGACITPGHIADNGQIAGGDANGVPVTVTSGVATEITAANTPFDPSYTPDTGTAVNNLNGLIATTGSHAYLLTPITAYDENNTNIKYTGTWTRSTATGAYGGNVKTTKASAATATLRFTGKSVSVIAPTNTNLGTLTVTIDGTKVATINQNAPAQQRKRIYSKTFTTKASHTIKLTRSAGTISLDAITFAPN